MRRLASFCFAFAASVFAAQYLLPWRLLLYAAAGCAILGLLWALVLRENARRRAVLIGFGLALALTWDWAYVRFVQLPFDALAEQTVTLETEVLDYPAATDYGCRFEVYVPGYRGRAVCYAGAELVSLEPGMRVTMPVEVRPASVIRGVEVSTHTARGVFALLYSRGKATVDAGREGSIIYLPQRLARRLQEVIAESFPVRTQPFLNAILLGDRYELSSEDKTDLSEAGLYHVTAVSGLHCAFLLSLLGFLIGRHRRRLLSAVAIPVLAVYALTVGLTPSVVRACVMLVLLLVAPLFGRESDAPTSLSLALFLILACNPFAVKSISLQLSFGAMAGLIWLTPRLYDRIRAKKRGRLAWFIFGSLAATAGALVFTIPLSAFYFNLLSVTAPLSNLLCLWAATATFATGLVTVLLGLLYLPLAHYLACVPHCGALYLLTAARYIARIPFHAVYFSNGYLKYWLVYAYALFFVCCFMDARRRYLIASLLAAATLALTVWLNTVPMHGGSLHIVALDVGQGQSVVLCSKGAAALVDCGSKSYLNAGDAAADYLQSIGVGTLDCVILSHYHADHCNGLPVLLSRLKVKRLVLPDIEEGDELRGEVLALAERYDIPVDFARVEAHYTLGEAELTVYPPEAEGEMNEECLAVLCTTSSFDALFTGDMDANTEYFLIANHKLPDIEMLMAGHHGSRWSTGEDLLAEVTPEVSVVSCGAGNSYGHPHEEALHRLLDAGAAVYRTDLQGNIHITVN